MDGWVGAQCGLKHVRLRMPKLVCHFGSSFGIPVSFFPGVMPNLVPANRPSIRRRALAWHEKNLRKDPFQLPREERKADPEAAAAFFECTVCDNPAVGPASICEGCGTPTLSWCEGCYFRHRADLSQPFGGICQACDREQVVCSGCRHLQVSWQQGHDSYESRYGEEEAAPEEAAYIEVTHPETGQPVRVTFAELSTRLGRSEEEIRREILSSFRSSERGSN